MSQELPPPLRERVRAYVEDVAPASRVDELEGLILEQLERRATRQPAQVMAIAHETVSSEIRITPDAAAAALVDHGGLSPLVAAHIVGLPVEAAAVDAEGPEGLSEPSGPEGLGEPSEPEGEAEPVIDGWDDFWSPPAGGDTQEPGEAAPDTPETVEAAEPGGPEGPDAAGPAPVAVRPDAEDRDAGPPAAPAVPRTFETWTGGASRRRSGTGGPLIAAAAGIAVVVLVIVGLMSIGGDGDPVAVGDPTEMATDGQTEGGAVPDEAPDDGPGTAPDDTTGTAAEPGTGGAPGAITVADADVAGEDGGAVQAGGAALLSLTVAGTGDRPATLRWELRRDGDEVFPAAPLVVPADGDVRLTIPPALLADAGAYVVRVSHEGAVLFERDFEVAAG